MSRTLPLSEVKAKLSEVVDEVVTTQERVTVTRNGPSRRDLLHRKGSSARPGERIAPTHRDTGAIGRLASHSSWRWPRSYVFEGIFRRLVY
ncbi:MAG: type II toxin-antitoxin system Phd/YefM family antitoxin [bacterium]|nr:type II toxin-antitoxin system Phd/YefM family antitoxin [bacterium]